MQERAVRRGADHGERHPRGHPPPGAAAHGRVSRHRHRRRPIKSAWQTQPEVAVIGGSEWLVADWAREQHGELFFCCGFQVKATDRGAHWGAHRAVVWRFIHKAAIQRIKERRGLQLNPPTRESPLVEKTRCCLHAVHVAAARMAGFVISLERGGICLG